MCAWRLLVAVISTAMAVVSILRDLISTVSLTSSVFSDILGLQPNQNAILGETLYNLGVVYVADDMVVIGIADDV